MSKVKLLLYCTKAKPYLWKYFCNYDEGSGYNYETSFSPEEWKDEGTILNGKIIAECDCENVEEISCCCVPYRNKNNLGYELFVDNGVYKVEWKENINLVEKEEKYNNPEIYKDDGVVFERSDRYIDTMFKNEDLQKMCLSPQQLLDYLKLGHKGYAIHLSNLKIFDKSKELTEYYKDNFLQELNNNDTRICKAPQNMCRAYDRFGNKYILISIRPKWLCKILNGEKTIEVRRVVTNKLKKLIGE